MLQRVVVALCVASCACTQSYHPEYHPVAVTTVHQSVSATPIVIEQPQLASPEVFFQKP